MVDIVGKFHDSNNKPIIDDIMVEAFEHNLFESILHRHLAPPVTVDNEGRFKIIPTVRFRLNLEKVYLIVTDPFKKFVSVREGQQQPNEFTKFTDSHGNTKWKSGIIDDINNIDITVIYQSRSAPTDYYEFVIVGSGFGGTISALTLANKLEARDPTHKNRVCILERGQWWVSHEMPSTSDGTTDGKPTIREYLEKENIPYGLWAYPDNIKGLIRLFANTRTFNSVRGLYDHKAMQNVHVVTASGVGGGSLVYFNLTVRPDPLVYKNWAIQNDKITLDSKYSYTDIYGKDADKFVEDPEDIDKKIFDYFDISERFIGVNTITTTAGLGKFKLPRTKAFQNTAKAIKSPTHKLINEMDLDAKLSITDIKDDSFNDIHPTNDEKIKYSKENNVCQRQGRCGLGCIPEARHTLNKQLYDAISNGKPIDIFPLCKVDHIEENNKDVNEDISYKYHIFFKDYRDNTKGIDRIIKAKQIILSAGTLGSTEILLRSKGNLKLSNKLGTRFSTNGDTFGVINPTKEIVDDSRGPMLTSIARFENSNTGDFEFSIEDLGIPKMFGEILSPIFDLMAIQKTANSFLPQTNFSDMFREIIFNKINDTTAANQLEKLIGGLDISSSSFLTNKIAEIITDLNRIILDDKTRAQSTDERLRNIIMLFGIGIDNGNGQLFINKEKDDLDLKNKYDLNHPVYDNIINTMKLFSKEIGRDGVDNLVIPFWDQKSKSEITAHPLGGCPMGLDSSEGVVDGLGRVFKGDTESTAYYDGLYVIDGSIIPSPLGVNPSLTISALAFRISEYIAGKDEVDMDGKKYWPK